MRGQCPRSVRAKKRCNHAHSRPTFYHGVPRIFLTAPLSYEAVAFHLGQCEKASTLRKTRNQFIDNNEQQAPWNEAMEALKAERWMDALGKLHAITSRDGKNAWAHFYKAICFAKSAEEQLNGYNPDRGALVAAISAAKDALNQAERHCGQSEKDLRNAIANLKRQLP